MRGKTLWWLHGNRWFSGKKNAQLRRRGNTSSAGPVLLKNQMLDSLGGYLENIAASEIKTVAKGGPLTELAASLAISFDTVVPQQQEIKCLYEHINALKKRGMQAYSVGKLAGGGLLGTVCTHCEAVGRTTPHRKNACYFDPRKMTDRKEWDQKLMDKKGVACKDDE